MFCKNCGLEISSDAKFCPGCGIAVEDTEVKNEVAFSEKAEENTVSPDVTENQRPDTESSIENKLDEAEKDTVQTQLADSLSEPEQAENIVVDSVNGSEQIEAAKSENSTTENIKEVLLPQKGKNGRVKFKDLSKKQKIIRIAIGGGLLLIALIWMISDGISGAKKAGNPSTEPEKTGSASIKTIAYDNDTGAVFDISLEEFSDLFTKTLFNDYKELGLDYDENWRLSNYWSNKSEPMTGYETESGKKFVLYSAFFEGAHIAVSTIGDKISDVNVGFEYEDNSLAVAFGNVVFQMFSGLSFDEAGEKIFDPVRNGIMDNTMIYKDDVLFSIKVSTISYSATPVSMSFVNRLMDDSENAENPPHIIFYGEDNTQASSEILVDNETSVDSVIANDDVMVDFFGEIEPYIIYTGANGAGEVYLDLPDDYDCEIQGVYFVYEGKNQSSSGLGYLDWMDYNFNIIIDNKKIADLKLETGDDDHLAKELKTGDTVCFHLYIHESYEEDLKEKNIYFLEKEHEYIVPSLGSFIDSASELTDNDIQLIKQDALKGSNNASDVFSRKISGTESVDKKSVEVYFATIKGRAENEHNAKGFVLVVIPDEDKKTCTPVEYFDLYRNDDGELTWTSKNSYYSNYFDLSEIDKMSSNAASAFGSPGVSNYSDYTFEKIG